MTLYHTRQRPKRERLGAPRLSAPRLSALAQSSKGDPAAQPKRELAKQLAAEAPPEFVPPKPWIGMNVRLGVGVGAFALQNDGPLDTSLGGLGVGVWAHMGDTFFDLLGYYISLRLSTFSFESVTSSGQTIDSFNSKEALSFEAGAGVDLWIVPRWISLSVEGTYQALGIQTEPVRRADYALVKDMTGWTGRARLGLSRGPLGLFAEYQHMLPMSDAQDGSSWGGYQATINLCYNVELIQWGAK